MYLLIYFNLFQLINKLVNKYRSYKSCGSFYIATDFHNWRNSAYKQK